MFLNFAALSRPPLVDATAISFAAPLITVASRRRSFASGSAPIAGARSQPTGGVVVMLWPYLDVATLFGAATAVGACAVTAAFTNAGSVIQTRRLTDSGPPPDRVLFHRSARWPGSPPAVAQLRRAGPN
jgi:hypothetical protein